MLRRTGFRSPLLRSPTWGGRGSRFHARSVRLWFTVVLAAVLAADLFLVVRSIQLENAGSTGYVPPLAPAKQGGQGSTDSLEELIGRSGLVQLGAPTLSDKELARLTKDKGDHTGGGGSSSGSQSDTSSTSTGGTSTSSSGSTTTSGGSGGSSGGSGGGTGDSTGGTGDSTDGGSTGPGGGGSGGSGDSTGGTGAGPGGGG